MKNYQKFLEFFRDYCGGYFFGHLPYVKEVIVFVEDWINNKGRPTSKIRHFLAKTIHLATGNSIFYLDYENGNDSNNGSSWALALEKKCPTCGKIFSIKYKEGIKRWNIRKYCSLKCRQPWNKGSKGIMKAWNKGKSFLQLRGIPRPIEVRKKISEGQKGAKAHNWKGGTTEINKRIRMGLDFRLWREKVFKRDNYTCQECGKRGYELHPHHIKEFAKYPELRFDINNGITLCRECHKLTNNYGVN